MHIEKNICDSVMGTVLDIDKKSKDSLKARLDLKMMGIRKELHPEDGKYQEEKNELQSSLYNTS